MGPSCVDTFRRKPLRCRVPFSSSTRYSVPSRRHLKSYASPDVKEKSDLDSTTEKYGLEAGLMKVFVSNDDNTEAISKTQQAKNLLAKYGSAYLITSVSFAVVSFSICYLLVETGVDVPSLLSKVGITAEAGSKEQQVGTFAIAYAAHKALSPARFPPTVALTPLVAKWLGKGSGEEKAE